MTRTFAHRGAWPLDQTGCSAMMHFIRVNIQEHRTQACERPPFVQKELSYDTDPVYGAWRTTNRKCNVTKSTKDGVTKLTAQRMRA